jgi:hypothetical protein
MRPTGAPRSFYAYTVGDALVELRRYREAISVIKRHVKGYPDDLAADAVRSFADAPLQTVLHTQLPTYFVLTDCLTL